MKVLMFGWEFPPYISGGLGTACHGLTENLGRLGVEVLLVLPRAAADAVRGQPTLVGVAHETVPAPPVAPPAPVPAPALPPAPVAVAARPAAPNAPPPAPPPVGPRTILSTTPAHDHAPLAGKLTHHTHALLLTIDSPLQPYLTVETYPARVQAVLDDASSRAATDTTDAEPDTTDGAAAPVIEHEASFPAPPPPVPVQVATVPVPPPAPPPPKAQRPTYTTLSVGYGTDLLREVSRYTLLGGELGRTQEFDVIHAHDWMTYMAGVEAKLRSRKPLVAHVHSTEYDRNPEHPSRDICGIEQYGLQRADCVITVSWRTRDLIIAKYDIDPTKIVVVHNAALPPPASAAAQSPGRPKLPGIKTVLFLGRVTEQKGPSYFVEAARQVLQRLPRTRFVVAGAGDLLPTIIAQVAALRLQSHFHFTGFLQGPDLEAMFGITDVYVMPSLAEPFGITALEAVRRGVPVIVSREAGVTEVLHHVTLVDPTDTVDMAAKIVHVLSHGRQTRTQVLRGQRELASLTWEAAASQVVSVYEALLTHQPPPGGGAVPVSLPAADIAALAAEIDASDLPPAS